MSECTRPDCNSPACRPRVIKELRSQLAAKDEEIERLEGSERKLNEAVRAEKACADAAEREVDRWKEREAESGAEADLQRRRADRLAAALKRIAEGTSEPTKWLVHEIREHAAAALAEPEK